MKKLIISLSLYCILSFSITGMVTKTVEYTTPPDKNLPINIKSISAYNGISKYYPFYNNINKELLIINHALFSNLNLRYTVISPDELKNMLLKKTSEDPDISENEALKIISQEKNINGIFNVQIFNYSLNNGKNFDQIMVRTKDVVVERLVTEEVYDEEEEEYVTKTFKRQYNLKAYNIEISYNLEINMIDIETLEILLSEKIKINKKYKYVPKKQLLDIIVDKDYQYSYVTKKPDIHGNLIGNFSYTFQNILHKITPGNEKNKIKFLKIPGYKNNDKLKKLIEKNKYKKVLELLSDDEDFNDSSLNRLNQFGILFYNMGCAYEMLDEIKTAKKYYKKAYEHNKNLNIGNAYQRTNERIKIEKELQNQGIKNRVQILH